MTHVRYPKYKHSGIGWLGEIPAHWEVWRFSHLFRAGMGETILKEQLLDEGALPVFSATELNTVFGYVESARVILKPGDLIIPARGNSIGHTKEVTTRCTTTQTTIFAKKSNGNVLTHFAFYFLNAFRPILFFFDRTAIPQITVDDVSRNPVIVPCEKEQRAIVSVLDRETARIDALIEKKQRQIELLQEKRAALIGHAVTKGLDPSVKMNDSGVQWLGEIPATWEIRKLKWLTKSMVAGPFGSSLTKDLYTTSGYRVYGQEQVIPEDFSIGDYYIREELFREMSQYAVSTGDVLISCVGTFGKIAVVPKNIEPGIINPRLIKLTPKTDIVSSPYLGNVLKSDIAFAQMERLSRGGTMGVLNIGLLSEIVVPIPSLVQQENISAHIEFETGKIDNLIAKISTAIEMLTEYRTALISAAVTGKIDVRNEAA
jgi:type I restriction enzyme S subunit